MSSFTKEFRKRPHIFLQNRKITLENNAFFSEVFFFYIIRVTLAYLEFHRKIQVT